MKKPITWPYFLVALSFLLYSPLPLLSFAPFYAIVYRRKTLLQSLWIAAGCGALQDLLGSGPFGIQTLITTATAFLLFRFRIYFVDKGVGLLSYTFVISFTLTLFSRLSLLLYAPSFPLTLKGFATDFLLLPVVDALYALLCFHYPLILYRFVKKQWFRFHFLRKDSRKKEEKEETVHGT